MSIMIGIGISPSLNTGGGGWNAALAVLRTAALASPGLPGDLPAEQLPTIGKSLSSDTAGLPTLINAIDAGPPVALNPVNVAKIRFTGGTPILAQSFYLGIKSATVIQNGNLSATGWQVTPSWETWFNSDVVEDTVFPQNAGYVRYLVNNGDGWKYLDLTNTNRATQLTSTTTQSYNKITFPNSQLRGIKREYYGGLIGARMRFKSGVTISYPPDTDKKRLIWHGDSYGEGSSASFAWDGVPGRTALKLGLDLYSTSIGGTGYATATSSGAIASNTARLDDMIQTNVAGIVIAFGQNDVGKTLATITANVVATLEGARARQPGAPIFVVGPWDLEAPAAIDSTRAATRDAIKTGVDQYGGIPAGVWWLDMTGVAFSQTSSHPNDAGAVTLSDDIDARIRAIIGA